MTSKDTISNKELEDNLNRIQEWIRGADQKISIFLAFAGVFITLVLPSLAKIFLDSFSCISVDSQIFFIVSAVLLTYSVFKSILALAPVLGKKNYKKSIIFFGDIAAQKMENFRKSIKNSSSTELRNDLIDQIYISSKIATKKHIYFKDSLWLFVVGSVFLGVGYFLSGTYYGNC